MQSKVFWKQVLRSSIVIGSAGELVLNCRPAGCDAAVSSHFAWTLTDYKTLISMVPELAFHKFPPGLLRWLADYSGYNKI